MNTKQIIIEIILIIIGLGIIWYIEYLRNKLQRTIGFWLLTSIEEEEDPEKKVIAMCNQCSFADYCKLENGKYVIYQYCPSCGSVMKGHKKVKEFIEIM